MTNNNNLTTMLMLLRDLRKHNQVEELERQVNKKLKVSIRSMSMSVLEGRFKDSLE